MRAALFSAGWKSWIYFPAKFQPAFSLTLGAAINLSDWLRSGAKSRSSPEGSLDSLAEGNRDVPLAEIGIVYRAKVCKQLIAAKVVSELKSNHYSTLHSKANNLLKSSKPAEFENFPFYS